MKAHTDLKRKSINKIIRLVVKGQMTRQEAYAMGFKKSQIQHLVDQRIANGFKPSISIYQCLVSERPANIDLSKVIKNLRGQTCINIFGHPTRIFNY